MTQSNYAIAARLIAPFALVSALTVGACGGGDGPTEPASDTTFTASYDGGGTFTAASVTITSAAGRLLIIASAGPNAAMGLGFELREGQQMSGTGGTATASLALIGQGSWGAGPNLAASSGFITLTTATANRVVGTFHFNLVSTVTSTPPTRSVDGRIDIKY